MRLTFMIPKAVENLLSSGSSEAAARLMADQNAVFLVDWREEDDAIVGYCEEILQTSELAAEMTDIDQEPGFELRIIFRGKSVRVPLVIGTADRHITVHTLNQLVKPEYEIRVCVASKDSDTLAFIPLPADDWASLEKRFGSRVARHFRKIEERPNLFTEPW